MESNRFHCILYLRIGVYILYLRMRVYILYLRMRVYILYLRITEFAYVGFAHIILRMWDLRKWDLRHRALPLISWVWKKISAKIFFNVFTNIFHHFTIFLTNFKKSPFFTIFSNFSTFSTILNNFLLTFSPLLLILNN